MTISTDPPRQSSSGYVDDLDGWLESASPMPVSEPFTNLSEVYVSPTGPTRLFTATRYGKSYMLKCLKTDYLCTPVYRQALAKEFEIGLQLDHPNICRTVGMEEVDGLGPVIIMERVDGDTLKKLIDTGTLTVALARKIADQTASALDYMHSHQTMHRDLKPSNIMVTRNGQNVKLIDFGLSDNDTFNVLKQAAGTSGYIAPEQLLPGAVPDVRSDIYSFGMVLNDMATATGDRRLRRIARACQRRSPSQRPQSCAAAMSATGAVSAVGVIMLAVLIAVVAALGFYVLPRLGTGFGTVPAATDTIAPDANQAVDYMMWGAENGGSQHVGGQPNNVQVQ